MRWRSAPTGRSWPRGRGAIPALEGDYRVYLLDARQGATLGTLAGHTDAVEAVSFAPDGRRLVSAGSDKSIRVWDARTGETLAVLTGHGQAVDDVAFSPDAALPRLRIPRSHGPALGRPHAPAARHLATREPCVCGGLQPRRPSVGPAVRTIRSACGTWPRARKWPNSAATRPTSTPWPSRRWHAPGVGVRRRHGPGLGYPLPQQHRGPLYPSIIPRHLSRAFPSM